MKKVSSARPWTKAETLAYIEANSYASESGCRVWTGPKNRDGYGQVGPAGIERAFHIKGIHRLVVHLVHGHEFAGRHEQVMHSCHNRSCVNAAHLSVGTAAQNMHDASLHNPDGWNRGEDGPSAKLKECEVREIKMLMANGIRNNGIIARFPDTNQTMISNIRKGRTWSYITISPDDRFETMGDSLLETLTQTVT